MIDRKTVLILGAGASVDLGYPTGDQLISAIHNQRDDPISAWGGGENQYPTHQFFGSLYDKLLQTKNIDTFLRNNPSLESDGRTLIAYILLKHERRITARMDSFQTLGQPYSWLVYLFDAITRQTDDTTILQSLKNLTIITFNYDVSLEAFFLTQFRQEKYQHMTQDLINHLEIIHVYGKLYDLTHIHKYAEYQDILEKRRNTGAQLNAITYEKASSCAKNIHVVNEKKQRDLVDNEQIIKARKHLADAEAIHVFGFAFDPDNLELLQEKKSQGISPENKYTTFTNLDNSETLKRYAHNFLGGMTNELRCSAYDAAANRIAW